MLLFALLGLGAGAIYALAGQGAPAAAPVPPNAVTE